MEKANTSASRAREPWRARIRSKAVALKIVLLASALIAALLATVAAPASSQDPIIRDLGTLELFASDATGDGVQFVDANTSTITSTESFTSNNKAKLSEVGPDDLVTLSTPEASNQLYVGLKSHLFGVRSRGEGSGVPASQVNGDQILTIALDGADMPGSGATFAQFGVKLKFGATVRIEGFDAAGDLVASSLVACDGANSGDCGSDSGGDRSTVRLPAVGATTTPFVTVTISVASPSDGAVSLLDEAGFETFFNIVKEFDGTLACDGDPAFQTDPAGFSSSFRRLNVDENGAAQGCIDDPLKPYDDDIVTEAGGVKRIQFEPDSQVQAIYRADLIFPAGSGAAFLAILEYDADGEGGAFAFAEIDTCDIRDATTTAESNHFPELAGLGPTLGSNGFPTMPAGETSCVVAFDSVTGGNEHWVLRVDADPWYR